MRNHDFWMLADDDAPTASLLLGMIGDVGVQAAAADGPGGIDAARILVDRPDVLAAYYSEYFGPRNDRNSDAWIDRVGGVTAEDYARYWYDAHGRAEGYVQDAPPLSSPMEGGGDVGGRVTYDGVSIAKILADRPDVFAAFFTEYYGAGNDRNSEAWVQRVGGATVEDYADYWYRAHGKAGGYVPSDARPPAVDEPPAVTEEPGAGLDPSAPDDPVVPADPAPAGVEPFPYARPLIATFVDGQLTIEAATDAEMAAMRSMFDDLAF